ncbi:MAG: hypothetical protein KF906_11925, partial [Actinobacteria bacterium]|nr:hypothetical protein [Actinomycetota bacterium]
PAPGGPPAAPAGWGGPPPPAGYEQPGGYGMPQPPMAPPAPAGPPDPNGLGVAAGRIDRGPLKKARAAFAVAGAVLQDGEQVEAVVCGQFEGNPAVLMLTDRNLVVVDDRPWRPTVDRIAVDGSLQVQGMQDNRSATLTVLGNGRQYVIDQIAATALAVEMAQRIRYRAST